MIASLSRALTSVNATPVVYFAKECDLATLNKAVTYVRANEQTQWLLFVHVVDDSAAVAALVAQAQAAATVGGVVSDDGGDGRVQQQSGHVSSGPAFSPTPPSFGGSVAVDMEGGAGAAFTSSSPSSAAWLLSRLPPPKEDVRLFADSVAVLDAMYPKLRIDSLVIRGSTFSPPVVAWLSAYLHTPPSMMFMASPDERFAHRFASLGGVRVITRGSSRHDRAEQAAHVRTVLERLAGDVVGGGGSAGGEER